MLLAPEQIFLAAQKTWNARAVPAYESFSLPCELTTLSAQCRANETVRFIVRLADGRAFAQTLNADGSPGRTLMHGGFITGPAGAPLGFYRRLPTTPLSATPPPNFAPDPLQTIASVQAIDKAYAMTLAGTETIGSYTTNHLRLQPLRDPDLYPLRDLWVDQASSQVVRLTYDQPFNGKRAQIRYDLAPVGAPPAWVIVAISAQAGRERVAQTLHDVSFPASEPPEDFMP